MLIAFWMIIIICFVSMMMAEDESIFVGFGRLVSGFAVMAFLGAIIVGLFSLLIYVMI